jgi:hypothetical protein
MLSCRAAGRKSCWPWPFPTTKRHDTHGFTHGVSALVGSNQTPCVRKHTTRKCPTKREKKPSVVIHTTHTLDTHTQQTQNGRTLNDPNDAAEPSSPNWRTEAKEMPLEITFDKLDSPSIHSCADKNLLSWFLWRLVAHRDS